MSKAFVSPDQLRRGYGPIYQHLSRCGDELSMPAKLVLLNLIERLGRNSVVWPSQETIAADIAVSDRTVRTAIGELRARGFVEQRQRGMGMTNQYTIDLAVILEWAQTGNEIRSDRKQETGLTGSPLPVSIEGQKVEVQKEEELFSVPAEPRVKSIPMPKATKITEDFVHTLHGEFDLLIGSQAVGDSISYWLGHTGFRMQIDKQAFLRKKLGESVERLSGSGRAPREVFNPVASEAYMLPEVRVSK